MAMKLRAALLAGVGLVTVILVLALREADPLLLVPGVVLLGSAVALFRFSGVALVLATLASWVLLFRTVPPLLQQAPGVVNWPDSVLAAGSLAVFLAAFAGLARGTARSGSC